jgi:cytochrome P450
MRSPRGVLPPGPRLPQTVMAVGMWNRPLASLERLRERYSTPFTIKLPTAPPYVFFADPDELEQIFRAPPDVLHPGEGASVIEPFLGVYSVILLDEGPHLEQRKVLLPTTHGHKMARLADLIEEVVANDIAHWPRGSVIELQTHINRLALEVMLRAVFGFDEGERLEALRERFDARREFADRPISLLAPPPGTRLRAFVENHGPFKAYMRVKEQADALLAELIRERRNDHAGRDDVLSILLDARHDDGSPMSDDEIRDELITMLVAGHETTASTLGWLFEALARHPDVAQRVREEIDSGDGDDYLTAVINETMRRRPVLPHAEPRLVKKPIEIGGYTYPPGVALQCCVYLVHHDPKIYPDPYAFRPERFIEKPPGTYTFIPFGGGRRRCVGASFAMLELKIMVRSVVEACEIQAVGDRPERPRRRSITITAEKGVQVLLRDRVRERQPVAAIAS